MALFQNIFPKIFLLELFGSSLPIMNLLFLLNYCDVHQA